MDLTYEEFREALEKLIAVGPTEYVKNKAGLHGEYMEWKTEGDDFGAFCHALIIVERGLKLMKEV